MSKNHNISIDEGIEKLRSLTISEKNKSTEKKNRAIYNNIINKNINLNHVTNAKNITYRNNNNINDIYRNDHSNNKNYKRKRNYLSLINNYNKGEISNISSDTNNPKDKNININNNKIDENTLIDAEALSTELLKCKNEEELKKVLFHQLLLLDQKKRNNIKYEELKRSTNILEKDKFDLLKCIKGVSRVLNKKVLSKNNLNLKINDLEGEISRLNGRINYFQSLGDLYKNELNKLKQVYY